MWTLAEIGRRIGARVEGDGDLPISGCAGLDEAENGDISFLADPRQIEKARSSRAGAVILPEGTEGMDRPVLRAANPRLAFARTLELFAPEQGRPQGQHPSSIVYETAQLGEGVVLGPYVVVEEGAVLEDGVCLFAGVYIGREARVGAGTVIYPHAVVRERVHIGRRCVIQPGAIIGSDGFGYIPVEGRHEKIPQIGTVHIGDDVEIGALTTIDRATCGVTRVGRGTKIDNLVQIAHNVQIGEDCLLVSQSGVAGSTRVGNRVTLAGQCGVGDHSDIADGTVLAARGVILGKTEPNAFLSGFPARPHGEQMRIQAATHRLPELIKTVRQLKARVEELEAKVVD